MRLIKPVIAVIATAMAFFPVGANASSLAGGIHFTGDVTLTTNISGQGLLTFDPEPSPNAGNTFMVDSADNSFSSLAGVFGNEMTLGAATEPIDTTLDVTDWLTFAGSSTTFTLTYVYAGVDPSTDCTDNVANQANGNLCTPAGTPFNLEDIAPNGTNSSASFVVAGTINQGGMSQDATITFTAASTGKSLEQILYDQEHGDPDVITYGAQLNTVSGVPEPGTSLMLGAGLLLAGTVLRRRKTQ